jgi:hypothetical protein
LQDFLDLVKNQFGAEAQATLEQFMKSGMTMQVWKKRMEEDQDYGSINPLSNN